MTLKKALVLSACLVLATGCSHHETADEAKSACEQRATELTDVRFNIRTNNFETDYIKTKCIHNEAAKQFMLQATRIERHECNYKWRQTPEQKGWCQTSEDMKRGYEIETHEPKITERFRY